MRRFGTGLFLSGEGLYKAPAARDRVVPTNHASRDRGSARRSLLYGELERNLSMAVTLSVVVPVKDEAENVGPLAREIAAAVAGEAEPELIFVDDGSTDSTAAALKALKAELPSLRIISHGRNTGQSRAVRTGVRAARADIVVTLDGDGQNDPADIPRLVAQLRDGDDAKRIGLVQGVRARREDNLQKRVASRLANRFRRWLLDDSATDAGCGLKAFRRDEFLALPYFDHMHRYMVALTLREGSEVRFVEVNHRPRLHGASKYGVVDRALVGINDLLGVRWLQKRFRGAIDPKEL
jgi:dolichol-phosphate mannosyltransferase